MKFSPEQQWKHRRRERQQRQQQIDIDQKKKKKKRILVSENQPFYDFFKPTMSIQLCCLYSGLVYSNTN